jgi:hypothetical protein
MFKLGIRHFQRILSDGPGIKLVGVCHQGLVSPGSDIIDKRLYIVIIGFGKPKAPVNDVPDTRPGVGGRIFKQFHDK